MTPQRDGDIPPSAELGLALARANGFSLDDLEATRDGVLSRRQNVHLAGTVGFIAAMAALLGIALPAGILIVNLPEARPGPCFAYTALVSGLRYTILFTPRTDTLLSIEPLGDHEGAGDPVRGPAGGERPA